MSLRILGAILRKDARSLWWLLALIACIFLADALIVRLDLVPIWEANRPPVILLALGVLVLAVFQTDSPASLNDDWLCRPVPKSALVAAKFLVVLGAIYLPRAIGALVADLTLGASVTEALLDALLVQDKLSLVCVPIFIFAAIVTRTFVQGFGALFTIFICVFVLPSPFVRPPGPLTPGIHGFLLFSGMQWLSVTPALIALIVLLAAGFRLAFWRRQIVLARVLMAVSVCTTLFLGLLPMMLVPWNSVFAFQTALGPKLPAAAARVTLRNTRECFAAARRILADSDPELSGAIRSNHLRPWDGEALRGVGPGSIAFVTEIEPRGLPLDWRVKLDYVDATYSAHGAALHSLRPARYITDDEGQQKLAHAWMIPESAVPSLRGADVELRLTYSLTVLRPRQFELPTDGKRHALDGLGYCSATVDEAANRVDVDCFDALTRPAQISAELNEIPASRVYGPVDFTPAWALWPYGQRVKLTIGSPRLAKHDTITLTAWNVAGYLQRSIGMPGILGDVDERCPLPEPGREDHGAAHWSDSAPHEAQSIRVDDGVQLEVLDFGGMGAPLVLLPGLGATAHSFDELGPQLARRHRVVALTRRGTGASSRPDFGFDTPRLGTDVLAVMDALHLQKVLLVGHSIAGDELTWLGGHHPERFAGLVYLDAAYDRAHRPERDSRLRELNAQLPPEPPIPRAAFASYGAMTLLLAQRGHVRLPEGELIAFRNASNPALAGSPAIDRRTQQAIAAAIEKPDYAALGIPALAIYAFADPDEPLPPWYDANDPQLRAVVDEIRRRTDEKKHKDIELFRRSVVHGEVLELQRADHYVIQSNPAEVLDAIEKFAAKTSANH